MFSDKKCTHTNKVVLSFCLVFMVAVSAVANNPITLNVTTDKPRYLPGDSVLVNVLATYGDGSPVLETRRALIAIKDAGNNSATEATELYRSRLGTHGDAAPYHPVKDRKFDCSWCHDFSRPERGFEMP